MIVWSGRFMSDYKNYSGIIPTRSGMAYPDFALGTYLRKEKELIDLLNGYKYNKLMIDTAYRYGNEQEVANAILKSDYPNSQIIIIGKINTSQQESDKTIRDEFMGTLHRLNVSKLDIYLIHSSRSPYYCKTWKEMIELQKEGLVDTIGVSNFGIEDIEKLFQSSGVYPEINQIVIPSSDDKNKQEVNQIISFCKENKILIQAAMPFGGQDNNCFLTTQERRDILRHLRHQNIVSVMGTSNLHHLYQNLSWIENGRLFDN